MNLNSRRVREHIGRTSLPEKEHISRLTHQNGTVKKFRDEGESSEILCKNSLEADMRQIIREEPIVYPKWRDIEKVIHVRNRES